MHESEREGKSFLPMIWIFVRISIKKFRGPIKMVSVLHLAPSCIVVS